MKRVHLLLGIGLMALSLGANAATTKTADTKAEATPASLEDQLKALDLANQPAAGVNKEKLYAVQTRNLPLKFKSEFNLGFGDNLTGDSFLSTQQLEVGYRFHFNDRWAVGLGYAWVNNTFKSDATTLRDAQGAIPDVPFATSRADLTVEFNTFYGKFRWSADSVSYFDQYVALGAGRIAQNTGSDTGAVADIGLAAWLGKWGSMRLGLKDYYYAEHYRTATQNTNNLHAHLDMGYLF